MEWKGNQKGPAEWKLQREKWNGDNVQCMATINHEILRYH